MICLKATLRPLNRLTASIDPKNRLKARISYFCPKQDTNFKTSDNMRYVTIDGQEFTVILK